LQVRVLPGPPLPNFPVDSIWQLTLHKVLSAPRVLVTPGWLHLKERIDFTEQYTQSNAIFVLTVDAHNDTQRKEVQALVRGNINRGIDYIYVVPAICENERSLLRFVETINTHSKRSGNLGKAIVLRTRATKNTTHQWKRIDHVMLLAHGDSGLKIERLTDIPLDQIDEGYEQLYRASSQPYGDYVWKSLSIREVNYYKELLEEWSELDFPEELSDNT